jgi:hypothetical protein
VINTGQDLLDTSFIKLSRTVKLSAATTVNPELNAQVTIEDDHNNNYHLEEAGNGLYRTGGGLNLPNSTKYRLNVLTDNGKLYQSDFVEVKITPPIDKITYDVPDNGLQLYVDTHDPQNNTRYYRWDFDETYKYVSAFQSIAKVNADTVPVLRLPFIDSLDDIYHCYKTVPSQQIAVGSSIRLTQDVISKQPIDFVLPGSGKLSHGYGILLRQYALTADAFAYWQLLQKDSQSLGSIFDAQPTSLKGNIHCTTDASEPVIGFVSASTVTIKRVYVDPTELTKLGALNYFPPPDLSECEVKFLPIDPQETFKRRLASTLEDGTVVLIAPFLPPGAPAITGYTYAATDCVDCRAKPPNGTNVKPAFFPSY